VTAAHGTYYLAAGVKGHLAVAIDSRITKSTPLGALGPESWDDQYCKITPLSDKVIFFDTGIYSRTNSAGQTLFDTREVAKKIFQNNPQADLEELSRLWAQEMAGNLGSQSDWMPNTLNNILFPQMSNVLVEGFFAGYEPNGTLGIYGQRITGSTLFPLIKEEDYKVGGEVGDLVHPDGYVNILEEFANGGATDRARQELQRADQEAQGQSQAENAAAHLQTMVEDVRDWSGDPGIGGDIAVILMRQADRKWVWYHRPEFCPKE
jgi:hypothetical protein